MNSLGSRARLVATAAAFVVGSAFGIEFLLGLGEETEFGHSRRGHILGWIGLLLELTWCRFTRHGRYDNGGRFLAVVPSPLEADC